LRAVSVARAAPPSAGFFVVSRFGISPSGRAFYQTAAAPFVRDTLGFYADDMTQYWEQGRLDIADYKTYWEKQLADGTKILEVKWADPAYHVSEARTMRRSPPTASTPRCASPTEPSSRAGTRRRTCCSRGTAAGRW